VRAGARERGSAGRARMTGQHPYGAGQVGRTAARRSRARAGGQRGLRGPSACVLPRDGAAVFGRRRAARAPRHGVAGRRATSWRGAAPASASQNVSLRLCLSAQNSQKLNRSAPVMNRKVVDLTTPYNFHKGCLVFFSTDFAGTSCQL
jgi:hypothetical protein